MTATLQTPRLWLTALDPDRDADDLHRAFGDPEAMRFWDSPPSADRDATRRRLAGYLEGEGARQWSLRESTDGPAVGLVGILGDTPVPGLHWIVVPGSWGRGFATEATVTLVEHALGEFGLDRVEAWVDLENIRSLGVARRAGLTERGRLPQRYPHRDRPHESVVLGRSRRPEPHTVLGIVPELAVRDVVATAGMLAAIFDGRTVHQEGQPPRFVVLGLGPWSGSPQVHLVAADDGAEDDAPVGLSLETATELAAVHGRAMRAGVSVVQPPTDQPWRRREFVLELTEGHRLTVSGPA